MENEKVEYYCGFCLKPHDTYDIAKDCCKEAKSKNPRIKKCIAGKEKLRYMTEMKEKHITEY